MSFKINETPSRLLRCRVALAALAGLALWTAPAAAQEVYVPGCSAEGCESDGECSGGLFDRLIDACRRKTMTCHRRAVYYHQHHNKGLLHEECPPLCGPNWGYYPTCWRPFPALCDPCPPVYAPGGALPEEMEQFPPIQPQPQPPPPPPSATGGNPAFDYGGTGWQPTER